MVNKYGLIISVNIEAIPNELDYRVKSFGFRVYGLGFSV